MEQKYIKGDIVMYNNRVHTITDTVKFNDYNLSDINYSVDQLDLSGVPLTFKILEKNGWVLYKHHIRNNYDDVSWIIYNKPAELKISLVYYIEEEAFFLFIYGEEISDIPIKYVHQVQHILYGLGLDSSMVV